METQRRKEDNLYNLYLIFGIVSSFTGVFLVIFNLLSADKPAFPVVVFSIIYFTIIILTFFFAIKWNSITTQKSELHLDFATAIKQSGIRGIYPNSDNTYRKIVQALAGRTESGEIGNIKKIKILAYHGHNLLNGIETHLRDAIRDGVRVKILLAKNNSSYIEDVWKMECAVGGTPFEDKKEAGTLAHKSAMGIISGFEKMGGRFECKTYNTQARYAIIIINDDWAWWTPYQPGIKVNDTTSFVLEKTIGNSILSQCIEHFNTLWDVSEKKETHE